MPNIIRRASSSGHINLSNRKVISDLQRWYVPAIGEFIGTAMFLYLAVGGADAVSRGTTEGT
ncbi:hypothetical protein BGZ91_009355, partial [Linnemannia elongata]